MKNVNRLKYVGGLGNTPSPPDMAPRRRVEQLKTYTISSYRGTATIEVGGTVLIRNEDERQGPFVAKIDKIFSTEEDTMVSVQWFYLPEELEGGRRDFHGAMEVFLSDVHGEQLVGTIECCCKVHNLSDYEKLEDRTVTDYFCRFAYSPGPPPIFYPEATDIYCVCKRPYNPDKFMFQCKSCLNWFHPSCMNMNDEGARVLSKLSLFYCKTCQPKMPTDL